MKSQRFDKFKPLIKTPGRAAATIIAAIMVIQLLGASRLGFGVDEAHYALYGRFPAWSYFDHPPMVGWLQWLMLHIGDSEFVLRLLPIFMLALSAWALYGLTRDLYPERSAWQATFAVLAMQSGMMFHLIGFGMLPDGPLILFGLLAMRMLVRIARGNSGSVWLYLGLLLGLAALSKYTAATLVFSTALILPVFGRWKELAKPWLWVGALLALGLCLPIVLWNMQNDWISIRYQIDHGTGGTAWQISKFLETQAGQLGAYLPGYYIFGWIAIFTGLKNWRQASEGDKLCLLFGLPIIVLFGFTGGFSRGLPHWPALGWAAVTPMMVCFIQDRWQKSKPTRIGTKISLGLSAIALLFLHSLGHMNLNPFPAYMHPLEDLLGWDAAAERAARLRGKMEEEQPETDPVIFARRWTHASRLGWYSRPEPLSVLSTRNYQFHIWYGEPETGQNGILVLHSRDEKSSAEAAERVEGWFETIEWIDSMEITRGGKPVAVFHFYKAFGLQRDFSSKF